MKWLATAMLLLIANLAFAQPNQPRQQFTAPGPNKHREPVSTVVIKAYIVAYSLKYKVDPAIPLAIAHIETRKGKREFRAGLLGKKYYGPFGLHKDFLSKWPIDQLETNVEVGVRRISGFKNLKRGLRSYNKSFDQAYWHEVNKAIDRYRQELRN